MEWAPLLDESIELVTVQMPARNNRLFDKPIDDIKQLSLDISHALKSINDKPYIIFGHSLGALVGFEVIHQLMKQQLKLPEHFIISARRAPQVIKKDFDINNATNDEFIQYIKSLQGSDEKLFKNPKIMKLLLPMLKADFSMALNYQFEQPQKLPVPITAFGGKNDNSTKTKDLLAWQEQSEPPINTVLFEGGHFFINDNTQLIIQSINKICQALIVQEA